MENNFLQKLSRLPKDSKIKIIDSVDNETRKGNYVNISTGLSHALYFVGLDKTTDKLIVEVLA